MARPTAPPTSASMLRVKSNPPEGGARVATRTAELAAWLTSSGPPPTRIAVVIASATKSAICHVPCPIALVNRSPMSTPSETPTTISTVRRLRAPSVRPSEIVAAIGAKNGRGCPMTSVAISHARAAPSAVCAIGSALAASRLKRAFSPARERRAASSRSSSPRAARVERTRGVSPLSVGSGGLRLGRGVDVVDELLLHELRLVVVDLARAGRLVAAAAVGEHQLADVDLAGAVEDRLAHGEDGVLLLEAPEHVHREVALREQGVQREAVGGVDDVLVAKVEDHQVAVDGRAAADLCDGLLGVLVVELHALGDVGRLEDLLDGHLGARVDELHHQLVVGDAELAEATEARAGVHQEAQQRPATGGEDLVLDELRGVGLVDRVHHLGRDAGQALGAAEVVVHHAGGRLGARRKDVVGRPLADAQGLRRVVVEAQPDARDVRQVGRDVPGPDLDLAVLHVLGVDEEDVLEDVELLEDRGADEAVEI